MPRTLMLVSQAATASLRAEVAAGLRPCPEYLRLERDHGVELLDWSLLPLTVRNRTIGGSLLHVATAARQLDRFDVVFSDGEHVGAPLGLVIGSRHPGMPHLMLAHHLTTPAKRRVMNMLRPHRGISRILVHSRRQLEVVRGQLGIPEGKLAFLPYFADPDFWAPGNCVEDDLVATAGREHRDYATLAAACQDTTWRVAVAAGSFHSPRAPWQPPARWPANFHLLGLLSRTALRDLFARAKVIAIPVLDTDFQAGVTTLLEAMAMGKAVVVSATEGQRDIVEHGETGVLVPPGHVRALRDEIARLMADPRERRRLGDNARRAVQSRFSLDAYTSAIAGHLNDLVYRADDRRAEVTGSSRTNASSP